MDRAVIRDEMIRARSDFQAILDTATTAELRQPSIGTKWTNEQLLFHMLFGYLIVRTLLLLVRGFAWLPDRYSHTFARGLNATTPAFHVVNYVGSLGGARILSHAGMERLLDRVITSLLTSLSKDNDRRLNRGMHFPQRWDPYFKDYMSVQDVYHYATQHYDHHRRQLTLPSTTRRRPWSWSRVDPLEGLGNDKLR